MANSLYLITSITQSGGSSNYDYVIDTSTAYDGEFTTGNGATSDGDDIFEDGEVFFYTVNGTTYLARYDGFVDVNAASATDFGTVTLISVVSGPDTDGLVGSQFAFTQDGTVPEEANRALLPDPLTGIQIIGLVCFAAGTLIETAQGNIPVENLTVGDLVNTKDGGLQKIEWINSKVFPLDSGKVLKTTPVRIKAHAFGPSQPGTDLIVSQQHRILVQGPAAELLFGEPEVLVPAKHLVNGKDIEFATDITSVEYVHFMFDRHQIVTSNGMATESFYPDQAAVGNLDKNTKQELLHLFPELEHGISSFGPTARLSIKAYQAAALMQFRSPDLRCPARIGLL